MKKIATLLATVSLTGIAFAGQSYAPSKQVVEPVVVQESTLNYNTVTVGYLHSWFDTAYLNDANGVGLNFTYNIVDHLYFAGGGSWQDVSSDFGSSSLWTAKAGLGGYISLAHNIDFVTEAGAVFYGFDDAIIASDNDASFYVTPHLRARFDRFEIHAGAAYANIDVTNDWAGFVDTFYGITENFDFNAGVTAGKDVVTMNLGFRVRY